MEAPPELRAAADDDEEIIITHQEYDDGNVIVIDFGPAVEASLDIVGETAIVVAGDRQFEFDVPEWAGEMTTNDGMLILRE